MLRKLLLGLALLAGLSGTVSAQENKAALIAATNAVIIPNGNGSITADVLNTLLNQIIPSNGTLLDNNTWALTQTLSVAPVFSPLTGYTYAHGAGVLTASTTIPWSVLSSVPTTLAGYGIASPLNSAQGGTGVASPTGYSFFNGASPATFASTIPWSAIASPPTTLSGYGITSPLPTAQGGTASTSPTGYIYFNGSSSPTFATVVPLSGLAAQAGNTILGNATVSSAAPTALAISSCSSPGQALTWTTSTGFGCQSIAASGSANPSATIGLTTVNGSAATFMRSDAAPALSQSITPTWTGQHIFTVGPAFDPTAGTLGQGFVVNQAPSGTHSGFALNEIDVGPENINGGSAPANNVLLIAHDYGGTALQGGRQTFAVQSVLTAASNASNALKQYVAGSFLQQPEANDGGTAFTNLSTTAGAGYAFNAIETLLSGATFWSEATSGEMDLNVETGASAWYENVLSLVTVGTHAVHGSRYDASLAISAISGSVGSNDGILFCACNGAQPVPSGGSLIATSGLNAAGTGNTLGTVTNGIDFSNGYTFTGYLIKGPAGSGITGAGVLSGTGTSLSPTASSLAMAITTTQSASGTTAGNCAASGIAYPCLNLFEVSSDNVDASGSPGALDDWQFNAFFGGASLKSNRQIVDILGTFTGASASGNGYVALAAEMDTNFSDNGTAATLANGKGSFFGENPVVVAGAGATNLYGVVASEADAHCNGCTTAIRFGYSSVDFGTTQGAVYDAAYHLSAEGGATGWKDAFFLTSVSGHAPLSSSGCVICTDGSSVTITTGIDLSAYTISGSFLKGPGSFSVTGAGAVRPGNGTFSAATAQIYQLLGSSGTGLTISPPLNTGGLDDFALTSEGGSGLLINPTGTLLLRLPSVATGTPTNYACFDASNTLIKSSTAC